MSMVYDNWERLVEATLNREKLRMLALSQSFNSSISSDFSSRFSFISSDVYEASRISNESINPTAFSSWSFSSFGARPIEFEEIKKATKNFHTDVLSGDGGFGPILKGWIHDDTLTAAKPGSGQAVAIKRWSSEVRKEWWAELNYLSHLHHPNLVKFIAYCSEEEHLFLVYEFMQKGSLDNHFFRGQSLSWDLRIKVAIGAARALSFLHDREIQVIHRNFSSAAVLLDGNFNAKLWDFSLAKEGPTGDTTTQVMETYGYAAPEYIATGCLTAKCDVYAFGVVLLELLSGRRVIDHNRSSEAQNLLKWAKPFLVHKRKYIRIMDAKIEGQYPREEAHSVAILASQCLNDDPVRRPKMSEVVVKLEKPKDV